MSTRILFKCLALAAVSGTSQAAILIDYDDGLANGIHDAVINDGEFTSAALGTWQSIGADAPQFNDGSSPDAPTGSATNYVSANDRILALDTGYTVTVDSSFDFSYQWIDKLNFDDGSDTVSMTLYVTDTNLINGADLESITLNSGLSTADNAWDTESTTGQTFSLPGAVGKTLFVRLENNANAGSEFARFDNIYVNVVPEPSGIIFSALGLLALAAQRKRK